MSSPDSPPAPLSPSMILVLHARTIETELEAELRGIGMSLRKLGLLGHLQREPGISFSSLARRAGIKVQSLQPIATALVDDGLVKLVGGRNQGRAAAMELTTSGRDTLSHAQSLVAAVDQRRFSAGEWRDLGEALTAVGRTFLRDRDDPRPADAAD